MNWFVGRQQSTEGIVVEYSSDVRQSGEVSITFLSEQKTTRGITKCIHL